MNPSHPTERWHPSVTVAAIIERGGKFLLVQEHTPEGLRLNNPAGHLDPGESLIQACAREVLEETAHPFTPTGLLGIYMSRFQRPSSGEDITYLRFAFCGDLGAEIAGQALDEGIVRTLWMTPDEMRERRAALWSCAASRTICAVSDLRSMRCTRIPASGPQAAHKKTATQGGRGSLCCQTTRRPLREEKRGAQSAHLKFSKSPVQQQDRIHLSVAVNQRNEAPKQRPLANFVTDATTSGPLLRLLTGLAA